MRLVVGFFTSLGLTLVIFYWKPIIFSIGIICMSFPCVGLILSNMSLAVIFPKWSGMVCGGGKQKKYWSIFWARNDGPKFFCWELLIFFLKKSPPPEMIFDPACPDHHGAPLVIHVKVFQLGHNNYSRRKSFLFLNYLLSIILANNKGLPYL